MICHIIYYNYILDCKLHDYNKHALGQCHVLNMMKEKQSTFSLDGRQGPNPSISKVSCLMLLLKSSRETLES